MLVAQNSIVCVGKVVICRREVLIYWVIKKCDTCMCTKQVLLDFMLNKIS